MVNQKKLSVVMPVLNNVEMTIESLQSLINNTKNLYEIVIIDDCSMDDVIFKIKDKICFEDHLDSFEFKQFGEPAGVTKAWNYGADIANGDYIAIVNNDVIFSKDWDQPLIDNLSDDVWITSPYHTRYEKPSDWPEGKARHSNGFPILGCTFMFEKKNWERFGPIDERIVIWYNDNWLVNRVTKDFGKQLKEVPDSYVHHYYSKTCNEQAKPGFTRQVGDDGAMFDIISKEHKWK